MNKIKRKIGYLLCTFTILASASIPVFAKSYTHTQSSIVTTSLASATAKCTGTYYSSGNTRWSRDWRVIAYPQSIRSASPINISMVIPTDTKMHTTATIKMVDLNYQSAQANKTYYFKFNGSNVVAGN